MNKILVGAAATDGLTFLANTGILAHLWPAGQTMVEFRADQGRYHHKALWPHTLGVVSQAPARVAVRWAALLHDAGKVTTRSVDGTGDVHFYGHEIGGRPASWTRWPAGFALTGPCTSASGPWCCSTSGRRSTTAPGPTGLSGA